MLPIKRTKPYKDTYLESLDTLIADLNKELRRINRFAVKAAERRRGYTDDQLANRTIIFSCGECGVNYVLDALKPYQFEDMPEIWVCDYCDRLLSRTGEPPKVLKLLFPEVFNKKG